jgi:hypothetical protein
MVTTLLWLFPAVLLFIPGFLDHGQIQDVLGTTFAVLVFIMIPGTLLGITLFKINKPLKALIIGSAFFVAVVIPLNAFLAIFNLVWILFVFIIALNLLFFIRSKKYFFSNFSFESGLINLKQVLVTALFVFGFILLLRQSLYVPANNLDQFLVWPDTYNALAQAGEITHHGPSIYPFVADAQVPLKYHWGAFSLGSFISLLGNFTLVISIFKTQFMLLGLLYLGVLYFTGKQIGQSWLAGIIAVVLGGLTIYPTFPEFNDQIGLARPFISSTSMPQFTANLFAALAIYFIFSFKTSNLSNILNFLIIYVVTLSATLSKGPVGLLIVLLVLGYVVMQFKENSKRNSIYLLLPTILGFIVAYSQITSSNSVSGKNGTSLWLNPTDTFKLLADGYGLALSSKTILIFLLLFVISFTSIIFAIFVSKTQKNAQNIWPLVLASLAGITGTLLFEAWGESQLFLLYGAIPFIGVLLASTAFYNEDSLSSDKLLILFLGIAGQPLIFKLFSSFVPLASVLKTFALWMFSVFVVWGLTLVFARVNKKSSINYLLVVSIGIGMFSGFTRFDQKAFALPEHPYSITVGTANIAEYLRQESNPDDLIATNRHCAGIEENQTCTARQFALSALSERRVLLEGWSYTTCPLSEPIYNKYWNENFWKLNQDFLINPNAQNWEMFQKSGVDWLVVDSIRPSASNYNDFAELVKTEGSVSLWKIKNPYQGKILKPSNPCGPDSIPSES